MKALVLLVTLAVLLLGATSLPVNPLREKFRFASVRAANDGGLMYKLLLDKKLQDAAEGEVRLVDAAGAVKAKGPLASDFRADGAGITALRTKDCPADVAAKIVKLAQDRVERKELVVAFTEKPCRDIKETDPANVLYVIKEFEANVIDKPWSPRDDEYEGLHAQAQGAQAAAAAAAPQPLKKASFLEVGNPWAGRDQRGSGLVLWHSPMFPNIHVSESFGAKGAGRPYQPARLHVTYRDVYPNSNIISHLWVDTATYHVKVKAPAKDPGNIRAKLVAAYLNWQTNTPAGVGVWDPAGTP